MKAWVLMALAALAACGFAEVLIETAAEIDLEGQGADALLDEHFAFSPTPAVIRADAWDEALATLLYTDTDHWDGMVWVAFGRDVNEDGVLASEEEACVVLFQSLDYYRLPPYYQWPHLAEPVGCLPQMWSHPRTTRAYGTDFSFYCGGFWEFPWDESPYDGTFFYTRLFYPSGPYAIDAEGCATQWDEHLGQMLPNPFFPSNWNMIRVRGVGTLPPLRLTIGWYQL